MGGDTANEYDRVQQVVNRLQAYHNQQAASQRMADDHDSKVKPTVYRHVDAVGVRIPGKNPRKGSTAHCLPCLVVDVQTERVGAGNRVVVHRLYTLWCPHGVLKDKLKVDKLVTLSINNFPALLELRDQRLTAQQRLASTDPNWQSPLVALVNEQRITLKQAWEAHRAPYKRRTEDQSRHRTVATRRAADAAGTSIAASEADARTALSLHSITNQPAPLRAGGASAPSTIVRILHANKNQYKVLWSEPQGSPAVSRVSRSWLDSQAEYMSVARAWRAEQQQQQRQQQGDEQVQEAGADAQSDSSWVDGNEEKDDPIELSE